MNDDYLFVSMGDPCGSGWTILKSILEKKKDLFRESERKQLRKLVIIGDTLPGEEKWLAKHTDRYELTGSKFSANDFQNIVGARNPRKEKPVFLSLSSQPQIRSGEPNAYAGLRSYMYFRQSMSFWKMIENSALLTLPVSKEWIQKSGRDFSGHTREIEKLWGKTAVMCMYHPRMSVIPLTEHIPLAEVPAKIKEVRYDQIARAIRQFQMLRKKEVMTAMLALNPHAGENGTIGNEEAFLREKVQYLINEKIPVEGPFPADGFFLPENRKCYSLVLAQYHDQGLIPFKMLAGFEGINITLNIPKLRVSPDHGPAYQFAVNGDANIKSVLASLRFALKWSSQWRLNYSSLSA